MIYRNSSFDSRAQIVKNNFNLFALGLWHLLSFKAAEHLVSPLRDLIEINCRKITRPGKLLNTLAAGQAPVERQLNLHTRQGPLVKDVNVVISPPNLNERPGS